MAEAVERAMTTGEHLLVQAGTGTGKSLGYLVPALLHDRRVVVATATLALRAPARRARHPRFGEGRRAGARGDADVRRPQGPLQLRLPAPGPRGRARRPGDARRHPRGLDGRGGAQARGLADEQADQGGPGDRDSAPKHTDRLWRQVSVNHRECLGASRCRFASECFAERAKEKAAKSQVIITNHSLLAIDAIEGVPMIPEYDVVVIDEAHELCPPG